MVVILVVMMVVMHLVTGVHVALCADTLAEQNINGQRAHGGFDHLYTVAGLGLEFGGQLRAFALAQEVGFVDDDHICAGDLVFEEFRQRRFVIEVFVKLALGIHCGNVMGKTAFGNGFAIHHSHNAIDGDLGGNFGPIERADQGLGQGEARCFDDDMIRLVLAREQLFHRGHEIIGDGAADATV